MGWNKDLQIGKTMKPASLKKVKEALHGASGGLKLLLRGKPEGMGDEILEEVQKAIKIVEAEDKIEDSVYIGENIPDDIHKLADDIVCAVFDGHSRLEVAELIDANRNAAMDEMDKDQKDQYERTAIYYDGVKAALTSELRIAQVEVVTLRESLKKVIQWAQAHPGVWVGTEPETSAKKILNSTEGYDKLTVIDKEELENLKLENRNMTLMQIWDSGALKSPHDYYEVVKKSDLEDLRSKLKKLEDEKIKT
jgi:hypothetical protein